MRVLASTTHFSLSFDDGIGLCRLIRTNEAIEVSGIAAAFNPIHAALRQIDRTRSLLLIDVRQAPLRNDPALEVGIDREIHVIVAGFVRWGVLVRTSAGALQVNRVSRVRRPEDPAVFRDEAEAVAWLVA
jgi:hypothetical protein